MKTNRRRNHCRLPSHHRFGSQIPVQLSREFCQRLLRRLSLPRRYPFFHRKCPPWLGGKIKKKPDGLLARLLHVEMRIFSKEHEEIRNEREKRGLDNEFKIAIGQGEEKMIPFKLNKNKIMNKKEVLPTFFFFFFFFKI
jgi:hypothetical protein